MQDRVGYQTADKREVGTIHGWRWRYNRGHSRRRQPLPGDFQVVCLQRRIGWPEISAVLCFKGEPWMGSRVGSWAWNLECQVCWECDWRWKRSGRNVKSVGNVTTGNLCKRFILGSEAPLVLGLHWGGWSSVVHSWRKSLGWETEIWPWTWRLEGGPWAGLGLAWCRAEPELKASNFHSGDTKILDHLQSLQG